MAESKRLWAPLAAERHDVRRHRATAECTNDRASKAMRDDFLADVKDTLAKRAGVKCSNPNCRRQTSGPQVHPEKSVNIGVAAHIHAASPGGARYDPFMTPETRRSIENGIWLCQVCAKLVDNDESRYTAALLRKWKQVSEVAALLDVEARPDAWRGVEITSVVSINQSGGQVARTIINQRPQKRSFTGQEELIGSFLRRVSPYPYEIHVLMNDIETADLARELKSIFDAAGWVDGKIVKGLGGYYPAGITVTRDKDSEAADTVLEALFRTGFKNVTGQAAVKGAAIGVYIGPNPDAYVP